MKWKKNENKGKEKENVKSIWRRKKEGKKERGKNDERKKNKA